MQESEKELLFFLQTEKIVFAFALTEAFSVHVLKPLCFLSLYVHCVGSGQIVHAKASECAAMIMGQGQECQPQR